MVPTGLTTLHGVFPFTATSTQAMSIVVHPRLWNPIMFSTTASQPYTYGYPNQYPFTSATTAALQTLAAGARVVSMKVKVYSTSSATSDNGALTAGLCPADPGFYSGGVNASLITEPSTAFSSLAPNPNQTSVNGYPITSLIGTTNDSLTNAAQGWNEFSSEDWTDTVPLKDGCAVFWLPQDPSSMIFSTDRLRQSYAQQANSSGVGAGIGVNMTPILDPFVCIGLSGLTNMTSTFNVEVFLNLEYTVTAGASSIIETRPGSMSSIDQFSIAKRVGGTLQNYVTPDLEASLTDKLKGIGSSILKGGVNRVSEFIFGSSDVGKAVTSLFS
jgi:hypothetical protein